MRRRMADTTDDIAEGILFQAFEDDCRLLGSLLHDVLLRELGPRFIHILEHNRILAQVRNVCRAVRLIDVDMSCSSVRLRGKREMLNLGPISYKRTQINNNLLLKPGSTRIQ
ncbi:hypothetical protein ACP4OV_022441 [Aristida adscensionis]